MTRKTKPETISEAAPVRGVDLAEMERLLDFMQKHRLEQLEYERDGIRVLLKKSSAESARQRQAATSEETSSPPASAAPARREAPSSTVEPPAETRREGNLHVIKSPIVGTFYGAPSPGAEPFVTVGAHVEQGQVLCIIEAMKLMNEIDSDVAGKVARVLLESGNPVEYGEPLFEISPDRKK